MADVEKLKDVAAALRSVDTRLRSNKAVEDGEKEVNLRRVYARYGFRAAVGLPEKHLPELALSDMTADKRWNQHFKGHKTHLAVYRSQVGYYWLLRYDPGSRDHVLSNVGTAADVASAFGAG